MGDGFFSWAVRSMVQSVAVCCVLALCTYLALSVIQFEFNPSNWVTACVVVYQAIVVLFGVVFTIMTFVTNSDEI